MAEEAESTEAEPKLDAKFIAYLRLLQRFGRSIVGLLLLEIGWTVLLVLASKLGGEAEGGQKQPGIPFEALWVVGAAVIALGWAVYSRLYAYLVVPLLVAIKPLADVIFVGTVTLSFGIDAARNRLIEKHRQKLIQEWIANNRANWIQKYKQRHAANEFTEEQASAAYTAWLEEFGQKYGLTALKKVAADEISLKRDVVVTGLSKIGKRLLTPLHSGLRIGIAPINNYSGGDDLVSLRSPQDLFGGTIANLLSRLDKVRGCEHINFYLLPSHFPVRTYGQARFAMRLFSLDLLVWGYFSEDQQNVDSHLLAKFDIMREWDANSSEPWRDREIDFFPTYNLLPVIKSLRFSSSNEADRVLMLVIAVLRALWSQGEEHRAARNKKTGAWEEIWERYKFTFNANLWLLDIDQEIIELLARDLLPGVGVKSTSTNAVSEKSGISDVSAVAAELTSRWIGNCFTQDNRNSRWSRVGQTRFAVQLRSVLAKCNTILPEYPPNFYRLGALSCLLGDKDRALAEFWRAEQLDMMSDYSRGVAPTVRAELDFSAWCRDSIYVDSDFALARFAANAAAAIFMGERNYIQDMLEWKSYGQPKKEQKPFKLEILEMKPENTPVGLTVQRSA